MLDEYSEQCCLMQLAALYQTRVPELRLLFHVPNGGHRDIRVAARLKRAGVKAGVPDLHLPVPRGEHHGLWIELKREQGGSVQDTQRWWSEQLREQGHRVEVCKGHKAAWAILEDYLGVKMPLTMFP
jgi:hypothetical protein